MTKNKNNNQQKIIFRLGVTLLIVACLFWLGLIITPFLSLPGEYKATLILVLVVTGEIAFWLGAILTGKEFVQRYKKYFNPRNWVEPKE